jgi:hypothetical protein
MEATRSSETLVYFARMHGVMSQRAAIFMATLVVDYISQKRIVSHFLMFMGLCIAYIFRYMSNKMQLYAVYLYLETALHVSGVTSTHHQECMQYYLQHLVFVIPLLLPAAIVEFQLLQLCALLMMGGSNTRNMQSSFQI